MTAYDAFTNLEHAPRQIDVEAANRLRLRLLGEAPEAVLEICQNAGHLSLFLAAVLKDQGKGSLTTFQKKPTSQSDKIARQLSELNLTEVVSFLPSGRSYTWALQRLISQNPRPKFDVVVLNGNKTWDAVGFSALLADMLLRQGGLLVVLDTDWAMATSPYFRDRPEITQKYSDDEFRSQPVSLVQQLIAPHLGYVQIDASELGATSLLRKS